jgi:hypothetical protein
MNDRPLYGDFIAPAKEKLKIEIEPLIGKVSNSTTANKQNSL